MKDRIRIKSETILSKGWGTLKKAVFDFRRRDGEWLTQTREIFDHGDGAAVIPHDPVRDTVLLVRQFRFAAYSPECDGMLIEACAGLLDADDPEGAVRREAEEELGVRLAHVQRLYTAFMSPGSLTERLFFFSAEYSLDDRISCGGGVEDEAEDIEVLEMTLSEAFEAVADGRIVDAKTIMLLQYIRLQSRAGAGSQEPLHRLNIPVDR